MLEKMAISPSEASSRRGAAVSLANVTAPLSTIPVVMPPQWNLLMSMASLLIVSHFGRPFEMVLVGYKIPAILCSIAIIVALITRPWSGLKTRIGIALTCLVGWMCFATIFSTWQGGSTSFILWYIAFWVVLLLVIQGAPQSPNQVARLAYVMLFSCSFYLSLSGGDKFGRFAGQGTFGNSDDVALLAGYILPFAILFASQRRSRFLTPILAVLFVCTLLMLIGRTGTRGAIPALVCMGAVYFIRGGPKQRAALIVMSVLGVSLMLLLLPTATLDRLATLSKVFDTSTVRAHVSDSEAMASFAERRDLLMDAINMATSHPLFGVGPGSIWTTDSRCCAIRMGTRKDTSLRIILMPRSPLNRVLSVWFSIWCFCFNCSGRFALCET